MIEKSVDDITRRNGKFIEVAAVGSEDMLKGDIRAVDADGNPTPEVFLFRYICRFHPKRAY